MAVQAHRVISDCASLPFSRNRAQTAGESPLAAESAISEVLSDLANLKMRRLPKQPRISWPPNLPEVDPFGIPSGADYMPWHTAQFGKTGLSGNVYGIKNQSMQPLHSHLEAKLQLYFDMHPLVVDCRTQYPLWSREEYLRYEAKGLPFPKNKIIAVDFMLTLALPGKAEPHYHVVSAKPRYLIKDASVIRRHSKEKSLALQGNASHEVMDEFAVSENEYQNCQRLKTMFIDTPIESKIHGAVVLARALRETTVKGSLERVMTMVGKRIGYSMQDTYRLFAIGIFLGQIRIDHRYPLLINKTLFLLK